MALTQISTAGVKDDAVTAGKIPADAIGSSEIAANAVGTSEIADTAVTLAKLEHGTSSNDGKFLRANNGADPSFETVSIPAGTTINNNTNDYVLTGTGTANTINGEANLQMTGNVLTFNTTANTHRIQNVATGNHYTVLEFDSNRSSAGDTLSFLDFQWNGTKVADIMSVAGSDTTNKDDGHLSFRTSPAQGSIAERMRITSSGRVGIGTTSPGHIFTVTDASSSIGFSRSGNNPQIIFDSNNVGAAAMFQVSESSGGAYLQMYTKDTSGNLDECIRVDPDQKVMMGSISSPANSGILTLRGETNHLTCQSIHTGGYYSIYFRSANTNVGNIFFNSGGVQFNTSSDYRRKENVVSLTGAIDRVKTLSPKRFNFISEPSVIRDGFLAHEVTAVPEAITGEKDAVETTYYEEGDTIPDGKAIGDVKSTTSPVYQCIDQSKLVPLLTAALQEAITKIETLETKVAALEAG